MPIDRISVKNFKSYRDLDVKLGPLNVFIGANASGKSNFLQIFRFFRDLIDFDLENAVSIQGGLEFFKNLNSPGKDGTSFEITLSNNNKTPYFKSNSKSAYYSGECLYSLTIDCSNSDSTPQVSSEKLNYNLTMNVETEKDSESVNIEPAFIVSKKDNVIKYDLNYSDNKIANQFIYKKKQTFDSIFNSADLSSVDSNSLLLKEKVFSSWLTDLPEILGKLRIFDINTNLPKQSNPITSKLFLEENGGNLAFVLKKILEDKEKKRKFLNLTRVLLPFITDLEIEKFTEKSFYFKLHEKFSSTRIPAALVSDGTINVIAMILILYFENSETIIIEEPEKKIHPKLISGLIEMAKEAAQYKQIIMTTHNPQIIRHVDLDSIYLVSRDKKGNSLITKPANDEQVQSFLENELGIDDLFIDDLLGGGSGV